MNDWLETLRAHVEWQLGDQVTLVASSERDHGGWHGIYIRTQNGWRHAVAALPHDMPEAVVHAFQKVIDERRDRPGKC